MGVRGVLRTMGDGLVGFHCPGCNEIHMVNTDMNDRPAWGFNDNYDAPTFTPSILVRGVQRLTEDEYQRVMSGETITPRPALCHSFVTDGRIQFLGDCLHELAGQTIELKPPP